MVKRAILILPTSKHLKCWNQDVSIQQKTKDQFLGSTEIMENSNIFEKNNLLIHTNTYAMYYNYAL